MSTNTVTCTYILFSNIIVKSEIIVDCMTKVFTFIYARQHIDSYRKNMFPILKCGIGSHTSGIVVYIQHVSLQATRFHNLEKLQRSVAYNIWFTMAPSCRPPACTQVSIQTCIFKELTLPLFLEFM